MPIEPINSTPIGVDALTSNPGQRSAINKTDNAISTESTTNKSESFFDKLLNRKLKPTPAQDLQTRMETLTKLGAAIQQHPMPALIEDYISNTQALLTDVNDNAYGSQYKDKLFEKLNVVNEKLIKVADDFQQSQKPTMDIVASLGELQGLLIDIFV